MNSRIGSFLYTTPEGGYDELVGRDGKIRPMFAEIVKRFDQFGPEEFARRRQRILNVLADNDLISSRRQNRASEGVDPMPMVIAPEEWPALEAGLRQRVRLFNALAADLYGEQRLWKRGLLPPALVHANDNFLSAVWGIVPPEKLWVHLMATDVVRTADGSFLAVGDHLQAPQGLGKALENRLAVGRAFPVLFRDLYVERLARFFKTFQECLEHLHRASTADKRIVLLASSPEHEKRNEDALLARYLGLQLVENDDLAIRGLELFLKTLVGLKKIDTIFRRIDDGMCDPLELRIDSGEGTAGLIGVMRAGNVAIANALGSGALEAPLFRPFLPLLAKELLGEELLLPTMPCRWLGEAGVWDEVQAHPDELVFRPAFGVGAVFDYAALTPVGQLALLENIGRHPEQWVAEPRLATATAPVWSADCWQPATVAFRFFMIDTPTGPAAMPGGLALFKITGQDGTVLRCGEKDVWVLSRQPVAMFSLLMPAGQPVPLSRAGGDLPSRAADHLYHLGRYVEEAEALARLARGIALRLADQALPETSELPWLFRVCAGDNSNRPVVDPESELWNLTMKHDHPGGLQPALKEVRRLATHLRDRISEDTWLFIHQFGEAARPDGSGAAALLPYLVQIITDSIAFAGLTAESMTRGHGWRFQEMGRRLERGRRYLLLLQSTLLRELPDENTEIRLLQALLEIGDGVMTYHRRYGGRIQAAPVIDLLLCDETNPRSVAYQVVRLMAEAKALPHGGGETLLGPLDRELLRLLTDLRLADVYALATFSDGRRALLENGLTAWLAALDRIAELLSRDYLNHVPLRGGPAAMATEV